MHEKEEGLEFLFKRISVKLNRSPEEFEPFLKMYVICSYQDSNKIGMILKIP